MLKRLMTHCRPAQAWLATGNSQSRLGVHPYSRYSHNRVLAGIDVQAVHWTLHTEHSPQGEH
jgi:hypothetical protein